MWFLRIRMWNWPAAALVAICLGGCGGNDGPQPVRAGGTVTYNNKPLPNAEVVFSPDDGGRVAQATTDEAGRFRLGSFRPGDGALVGKHGVAVIARGPAKPPPPGSPAALMPDDYPVAGDPRIPEKYFSAATSGLTAEVELDGDNEFYLELHD